MLLRAWWPILHVVRLELLELCFVLREGGELPVLELGVYALIAVHQEG